MLQNKQNEEEEIVKIVQYFAQQARFRQEILDAGLLDLLADYAGKNIITLHKEIPETTIASLLKIGRQEGAVGRDGKVYRSTQEGEAVAIKIFTYLDSTFYLRKIAVMSMIYHQNIVLFLGALTKSIDKMGIMTRYHMERSLKELINKKQPVELKDSLKLALEIAQGMQYLHKLKILHRNLTSSNVLVTRENNKRAAKVCDFDLVRNFEDQDAYYLAPELFTTIKYSQKSDIYSYGILLHQIITKEVPVESTRKAIMESTKKGNRPAIPKVLPKNLQLLMANLWNAQDTKRPSFNEIVPVLEEVTSKL